MSSMLTDIYFAVFVPTNTTRSFSIENYDRMPSYQFFKGCMFHKLRYCSDTSITSKV